MDEKNRRKEEINVWNSELFSFTCLVGKKFQTLKSQGLTEIAYPYLFIFLIRKMGLKGWA